MSTRYSMQYLTDGCWSPTRPSVFVTSKMDGTIDVWDYLFKQTDPTISIQVGLSPVHSVKIQEHGKHMAASSRDGSTTIFELSDSLAKCQTDEKKIFGEVHCV